MFLWPMWRSNKMFQTYLSLSDTCLRLLHRCHTQRWSQHDWRMLITADQERQDPHLPSQANLPPQTCRFFSADPKLLNLQNILDLHFPLHVVPPFPLLFWWLTIYFEVFFFVNSVDCLWEFPSPPHAIQHGVKIERIKDLERLKKGRQVERLARDVGRRESIGKLILCWHTIPPGRRPPPLMFKMFKR